MGSFTRRSPLNQAYYATSCFWYLVHEPLCIDRPLWATSCFGRVMKACERAGQLLQISFLAVVRCVVVTRVLPKWLLHAHGLAFVKKVSSMGQAVFLPMLWVDKPRYR